MCAKIGRLQSTVVRLKTKIRTKNGGNQCFNSFNLGFLAEQIKTTQHRSGQWGSADGSHVREDLCSIPM